MPDRSGKRKTREQFSKRRIPELGYYFIVTDKKRCAKRHLRFRHHSFGKQSSNINCFSADGSAKAVLNGCKFVASWF